MTILGERIKLAQKMRHYYQKKEGAHYNLFYSGKWSDVNDTDKMERLFDVAIVSFITAENAYWDHVLEEGELPPYAWPGGGNIVYYDREGNEFCAECAQKELSDPSELMPLLYGSSIHEEGPDIYCASCNVVIESALGDPEDSYQIDSPFDSENEVNNGD